MRNIRMVAITSLIIFSLFVTMNNGIRAHESQNQDRALEDSVSKWEKRVKSVLKHVPGDVNVLGYVADWNLPNTDYDLIDQENEYTLTQYTLAPRAVQPGLDQEWIIGNFTKPGFRDWLDENLPSYEIIELGFGMFLIHRTSR